MALCPRIHIPGSTLLGLSVCFCFLSDPITLVPQVPCTCLEEPEPQPGGEGVRCSPLERAGRHLGQVRSQNL